MPPNYKNAFLVLAILLTAFVLNKASEAATTSTDVPTNLSYHAEEALEKFEDVEHKVQIVHRPDRKLAETNRFKAFFKGVGLIVKKGAEDVVNGFRTLVS